MRKCESIVSNEIDNSNNNAEDEATASFSAKLFQAILGAQQIQAAWLGGSLGWYECLADHGPLSPQQLAMRTESSERYAREWCEHQTVCGWIQCVDPHQESDRREYSLSPAQKTVLTDKDSTFYFLPGCKLVAEMGQNGARMLAAYKNDTGVSCWSGKGGSEMRDAMAESTRPLYLRNSFLPQGWPSLHHQFLNHGGRVADIGAGCAWSSIGVAKAYPKVTVDAFDLDGLSIERAKLNIADMGLQERVKAQCINVGTMDWKSLDVEKHHYDLVMALECVHDLSDPVSVLRTMKQMAGPKGVVLVMDHKVQDTFAGATATKLGTTTTTNHNDIEKLCYGFSLHSCLAEGKSYPHSAATGAVMRPHQLESFAIQAGFAKVQILWSEHIYNFYNLVQ